MWRRLHRTAALVGFMLTGGALFCTEPEDVNDALRFYLQNGPCDHCWTWPCWCGNKPRLEIDAE